MNSLGSAGSSRRSLIDLLIAQVVPLAASALTTFATASILGVAERGELSLIVSTGGLIGAVAYLSVQVGVVRSFRQGDTTSPRRAMFFTAAIGGIIVFLATLAVVFWPSLRIGGFTSATFWMAAVGGGLVTWNLGVLRIRQGLGQSALFRNAWLIQSLAYMAAAIPTALLTRSSLATSACWLAAILASTLFVLTHQAPAPVLARPELRTPLRRILGDSFAAHIAVVGQQLMHSGDIVILGLFASVAQVGLYSVAVPIAGFVWVISEALSLLTFQLSSQADSVAARLHRRRLGKLNLIYGGAAALIVAAASFLLLPLILPAYASAGFLVLLLLPGVVIQGYARIALSSVLAHAGRARLALIGVGSTLLTAIYIPATILFGALGAALASTIIYCLQTVLVTLVIRHSDRGSRSMPEGAKR